HLRLRFHAKLFDVGAERSRPRRDICSALVSLLLDGASLGNALLNFLGARFKQRRQGLCDQVTQPRYQNDEVSPFPTHAHFGHGTRLLLLRAQPHCANKHERRDSRNPLHPALRPSTAVAISSASASADPARLCRAAAISLVICSLAVC